MLESVRIEAFAIMSGVADAVSAWFLPTGSGSAAIILVGSSPFFIFLVASSIQEKTRCHAHRCSQQIVLALPIDLSCLDLTVVMLHFLNPGSRSNYSVSSWVRQSHACTEK